MVESPRNETITHKSTKEIKIEDSSPKVIRNRCTTTQLKMLKSLSIEKKLAEMNNTKCYEDLVILQHSHILRKLSRKKDARRRRESDEEENIKQKLIHRSTKAPKRILNKGDGSANKTNRTVPSIRLDRGCSVASNDNMSAENTHRSNLSDRPTSPLIPRIGLLNSPEKDTTHKQGSRQLKSQASIELNSLLVGPAPAKQFSYLRQVIQDELTSNNLAIMEDPQRCKESNLQNMLKKACSIAIINSDDNLTDEKPILKYEKQPSIILPFQELDMLKIENDNVKTEWKKAVDHSKYQEDKLKSLISSDFRNKPFCKENLIHLFEALQFIENDQQLEESKKKTSLITFGGLKNLTTTFKKINMFSMMIYDISNKRALRLMCKPSLLSSTIFIDDVGAV